MPQREGGSLLGYAHRLTAEAVAGQLRHARACYDKACIVMFICGFQVRYSEARVHHAVRITEARGVGASPVHANFHAPRTLQSRRNGTV